VILVDVEENVNFVEDYEMLCHGVRDLDEGDGMDLEEPQIDEAVVQMVLESV
jgi:hypothetical protein